MSAELQAYNTALMAWNAALRRRLLMRIKTLTRKNTSGYSLTNTRSLSRKFYGEINRLSTQFPVYMVFYHKGAGRGYGGSKSGEYTAANGGKKQTDRRSMGRMGTGNRKANPWFNPIIEEEFPKLANIVAQHKGERVLKEVEKILIK